MEPASVEVAIVNWNTAERSLAAARAYRASRGVRVAVTIVDNCSRREERALLLERRGGLRLLLSGRNLGYGGAANLALRGDADLVCVSNGDLLPRPDALARLAHAALCEGGSGMVGPVYEGGTQHYHGRLPGPATLLGRTLLGRLGGRGGPAPAPGEIAEVGQVSGACVVMRTEAWRRSGGFDDRFFLWYDDVDLARRLTALGHRNLVVGSAIVRHSGAGSFAQLDRRRAQAIRLDSLERYISKHHPRWAAAARPLLGVSRALRARGVDSRGGVGRGEEAHAAMSGEVLEIRDDAVPAFERSGVAA